MVRNAFPNAPVYCEQPFEAIARGACCYAGDGIPLPLVHDYCLKGWDRQVKEFKYVTVVPSGTTIPQTAISAQSISPRVWTTLKLSVW